MSPLQKALVMPSVAMLLAVLFILLASTSLPAFAQGGACAQDVQTLCKNVPQGRGNVLKCLQQHQSELSPACLEQIQGAKAQSKEVGQACQGDVQQLCQGVKPGQGRMASCLKAHESELSTACKDELAQVKSKRQSTK
jgi:Cysteine rich repeat